MPSTYTQNLGLQMPADGEQAGTWGDTVNFNYEAIDAANDGNIPIPFSASSYSLITSSVTSSTPSQGRNKVIIWSGVLTQQGTVNIQPNTAQKLYLMVNQTSGGFAIGFQQGTGGVFTLQPGYSAWVYTDGAGNTASVAQANANPQFTNVLVQGTLTVQGATTYTGAVTLAQASFTGPVTMTGGLTTSGLTIAGYPSGTPASFDLYYRSAGGQVVGLPVGAPGQNLIVNSSGAIAWGTSQISVGLTIAGSIPNAFYYSASNNALAQSANYTVTNGGIGIGVAAASVAHTLHIGLALAPELVLDASAPSTQQRVLGFATNNQPRWMLYTPAAAENPPNNTGSNLALISYNDAASATKVAFSAFRNSGNFTIGSLTDVGGQFNVVNQALAQPAMIVRGAVGQAGNLQQWQDSNGNVLASIDSNGVLTSAGAGSGYLQLDINGRLNLHGTVPGSAWGTIHIGPESPTGPDTRGTIAFQSAVSNGQIPSGIIRMYYRATPTPYFVIQFYYNGANYYAYLNLVGQVNSNVSWGITTTPL